MRKILIHFAFPNRNKNLCWELYLASDFRRGFVIFYNTRFIFGNDLNNTINIRGKGWGGCFLNMQGNDCMVNYIQLFIFLLLVNVYFDGVNGFNGFNGVLCIGGIFRKVIGNGTL